YDWKCKIARRSSCTCLKRITNKKRIWVHDLWKKRKIESEFATLYRELVDHEKKFFEYFRMSQYCFNLLLSKIEYDIKKQDTFWRQAITSKERLAVCLRYTKWSTVHLMNCPLVVMSHKTGKSASNKDEKNDIRKINILLNLIGPQGVKIYNNFKKKEKTNFDTIVQAFNQYCEPRKNIIFQRYKFGCCIQQEGQSFDDFLTELKTLAATCEYKEEDNMIRDRIVFGVKDPEIKDKLVTISNLTMDKAEEICKTTEATKQEPQEMATSSEVHMVKMKSTGNGKGKNLTKTNNKYVKNKNIKGVYKKSDGDKNNEYNCKKCGRKHKLRECFAFGYKNKNKEEKKEVHETHYGEEMFQIDTIFNVHQINSWTKTIRVINKNITFKLDSGSDVNIIPWEHFKKIKPHEI
ncbi:hypothetical protein AGLY_002437, partial [Aphis glycines]